MEQINNETDCQTSNDGEPVCKRRISKDAPQPYNRDLHQPCRLVSTVSNLASISTHFPVLLPKYIQLNYTKFFQTDPNSCQDICILVHTNKLCVVTVAPSHPIYKLHKHVRSVSFDTSDGMDRSQSRAQGHRKKGAQQLAPGSVICHVQCDDDISYAISSPVNGKLLEVNTQLLGKPELLMNMPMSNGYIAIIMPNAAEFEDIEESLADEKTYMQLRFPQPGTTAS